jgi:RNA polymerase sigma-70 factor (ECF subfamily)
MIAFDSRYDDSTLDPDTERMVRVAAGDRAAFDELVRRNFASTVRIISAMMGSYCQSEDLAQDVFLRVYRSRQRYLPTAKFSTWLGTIVRNVVLNAKRTRGRSRVYSTKFVDDWSPAEHEFGTTIAPLVEYNLAEELDQQETVAVVTQAIGQLPQRQRMAIELVHFRGMSYDNAAVEMDTTRKAVKSLLGRGRITLGKNLER